MSSGMDGILYDFRLAEPHWQLELPVSRQERSRAEPEPEHPREQVESPLSVPGLPKLASFPGSAGVFLFNALGPAAEHLADFV